MRLLRIEDNKGRGYKSVFPSNNREFNTLISGLKLTPPGERVFCFIGGRLELLENYYITEIEFLQLFFLFSISNDPSHPFYNLYFKDFKTFTVHPDNETYVTNFYFMSDRDFIKALKSKGFNLYYASLQAFETALCVGITSRIEWNNGQIIETVANEILVPADFWNEEKQEYKPVNTKERVLFDPFTVFSIVLNNFRRLVNQGESFRNKNNLYE
jgi:hypothetical protein